MFDSRVVEDETVELEDLVENRDVGDLLDVEADVAVQRRDPLKLARLKPASVAHVGSPDNVQLAWKRDSRLVFRLLIRRLATELGIEAINEGQQ